MPPFCVRTVCIYVYRPIAVCGTKKTLKLFQQNITFQSQYFSTGCFCENCSSGVWKLKIFTLKSTFEYITILYVEYT